MKYGVISDLHSNLEALESVLRYLKDKGAEGYLCLGDIVGYGPDPNDVIKRVRALSNLVIVAGNHDVAAIGKKDLSWFNPHARSAAIWTQRNLSEESRAFLASLPERAETKRATLVHGTPRDPIDEYFLDARQLEENKNGFSTPVCFVGHSHIPFIASEDPRRPKLNLLKEGEKVRLDPAGKCVINPGAVGQPRDGNPRASCALFDEDALEVTLFRVGYDIDAVQEKMRREDSDHFLVERLAIGR